MDQVIGGTELRIERARHGLPPSKVPPASQKPVGGLETKRRIRLRRLVGLMAAIIAAVGLSYNGWRYWTVGR
jgi:hypothetical protein